MKTISKNLKIFLISCIFALATVFINNPLGVYTFKLTTLDTTTYSYGFSNYRGAPLPFFYQSGSTSYITTPDVIIEPPVYNPPIYSPIAFIFDAIVIFLILKIIIIFVKR